MRNIEPITRNEKYLAAAGGQEVTVPTPITRSEIYLAAMSDENIIPPTAEDDVYQSKIDNNVWSPADYPQGWQKLLQE